MSDTIKKRKNFLSLCSASNEKGVPELVNALANGTGRCDAAELNRMGRRIYKVQQCTTNGTYGRDKNCTWVTKTYIANTKPFYCSVYFNHEWTADVDSVKYIGVEKNGGKWVNVK